MRTSLSTSVRLLINGKVWTNSEHCWMALGVTDSKQTPLHCNRSTLQRFKCLLPEFTYISFSFFFFFLENSIFSNIFFNQKYWFFKIDQSKNRNQFNEKNYPMWRCESDDIYFGTETIRAVINRECRVRCVCKSLMIVCYAIVNCPSKC